MPETAVQVRDELRAVLAAFPHAPRAYVKSYGCQLNFCEGEKYKGILQDIGYLLTEKPEEADLILLNACAVRAHAEDRVLGHLGALKPLWEQNPRRIIGLCGCMAEDSAAREQLKRSYPFVKLVLGASAMEQLPAQLLRIFRGESYAETLSFQGLPDESLPTVRSSRFQASVPIMYGCNNFCTYCIVPLVRGRERSRTPAAIEREVRELILSGTREILLLGQNVNSYGRGTGGAGEAEKIDFPALLRRLDAIEGDYVIRFMSSHPKDATKELIDTMIHSEHIEHHLHLPVQSGSDRVLREMNRHYTMKDYLAIVDYAREKMPDFGFSSDVMVGFPTETEQDFQDTLRVVERVKYDNLYTFIYSPRSGTKAAEMKSLASGREIGERMQRLLAEQRVISEKNNARFLGKKRRILVEKLDEDKGLLLGKTREGVVAEAPGSAKDVGKLVTVQITGAKCWALSAEILR